MAKNKYTVIKHPTQINGMDMFEVRNRETGRIKFLSYRKYMAQDLANFVNGKGPSLAGYTAYLAGSHPAQYGIPCDQIEG